jgi:membrane protein YqaA with SNARE-associated domain
MIQRLYIKVLAYSKHPYALGILCLLAFAEASFFPIPPDVLMLTICLAHPRISFKAATLTTVFSVLGGMAGYMIGFYLWQGIAGFFFEYIISVEKFAQVRELYENNAFFSIFLAGYTPIPYKIFTISAGVFHIPLPVFISASFLGRAMRFFLFATLIYHYGEKANAWLLKNIQKLILISSVVITIVAIGLKWTGIL